MLLRKQLELLSILFIFTSFVLAKKDVTGVDITEAKGSTEKLKKAPPPEFVEMAPFTVSVIKNGAAIAFLRIEVTLEAHDVEGTEIINIVLPKVRDAILVDLHGAMSKFWVTDAEPSMFALKKRIERIIEDKIFTKEYSIKGKLIDRDMIKSVQIKNMALQHVE